jgi:hypothetical protein
MLSPGEACPKHDVPLEPQPEHGEDAAAEEQSTWVVAATFGNDAEPEAKRLRLEAEGIPTLLDNERMGSGSMLQIATGGIRLRVPRQSLADARVILSQAWTLPASQDLADDDDDGWGGLDHEGSFDRRRRAMKAIIWLLLAPSLLGFAVGIVALFVMLIRGLMGLFHG